MKQHNPKNTTPETFQETCLTCNQSYCPSQIESGDCIYCTAKSLRAQLHAAVQTGIDTTAKLLASEQHRERLRRALEEVTWQTRTSPPDYTWSECTSCGKEDKHAVDCELAAALVEPAPATSLLAEVVKTLTKARQHGWRMPFLSAEIDALISTLTGSTPLLCQSATK